ncbi:DUF1345 domain-containing protein [Phenylobacterium sp.]|uniref:DUF1345 domain-containing protein n=1 Tax=Phenylobacterium sp. TaxID=1871053 RepID=UPI00286D0FDD|nr:DUF1345 domain-containing protein [Phenylobacterium sp.]
MSQARTRRLIKLFAARPRLAGAFAFGLVVWLICLATPSGPDAITAAVLGWNATCLGFIAASLHMMWGATPSKIRAIAATQDEGQAVILGLVILSTAASIVVIAAELSAASGDSGLMKALRVGLVFSSVAASWFFVQMIFALHYAHEYYAPYLKTKRDTWGLLFPGGEAPDYWDFVHFSVVIGVASQTADVAFTSKALRRVGTLHGIVAFVFNTVVVALTINLLAGLFAR